MQLRSSWRSSLALGLLLQSLLCGASPAGALQIPFTATLSLGTSNFVVSAPIATSGSGTAEVSFAGTSVESVQLPGGTFMIDAAQEPVEGAPPITGVGFDASGSSGPGSLWGLDSAPLVSLPLAGTFTLSIVWDFGFTATSVLPFDLGLVGTTGAQQIPDPEQMPEGDPVLGPVTWQAAPWSLTGLAGNSLTAESFGSVMCSTCSPEALFGAALAVQLAFDPSQSVGFGSGTGSASLLGGVGTVGGVDLLLDADSGEGILTAAFRVATLTEIEDLYGVLPFPTADGASTSLWEISGGESFHGIATLTFAYDPSLLPPGFDENLLSIAHFDGSSWVLLPGKVDVDAHTITAQTDSFSPFSLVTVPEPGTALLLALGLAACGAVAPKCKQPRTAREFSAET
jgi:hypothetical protein